MVHVKHWLLVRVTKLGPLLRVPVLGDVALKGHVRRQKRSRNAKCQVIFMHKVIWSQHLRWKNMVNNWMKLAPEKSSWETQALRTPPSSSFAAATGVTGAGVTGCGRGTGAGSDEAPQPMAQLAAKQFQEVSTGAATMPSHDCWMLGTVVGHSGLSSSGYVHAANKCHAWRGWKRRSISLAGTHKKYK